MNELIIALASALIGFIAGVRLARQKLDAHYAKKAKALNTELKRLKMNHVHIDDQSALQNKYSECLMEIESLRNGNYINEFSRARELLEEALKRPAS